MKSSDFWDSLHFKYIKTYSINRDVIDYELELRKKRCYSLERLISEFSILTAEEVKVAKKFRNDTRQEEEQQTKNHIQTQLNKEVINENGFLDKDAKFVSLIEKHTHSFTLLKRILFLSVNRSATTMCWPVYRDAIVFYDDEDKIVNQLTICFECLYLQDMYKNNIESDWDNFKYLKEFLFLQGHKVYLEERISI